MSKLRYVRHPYLISRAITGFFETRLSSRKRIREYDRYVHGIENGLTELLGIDANYIADFRSQLSNKAEFQERMNDAREFLGESAVGVDEDASLVLYIICRALRPKIAVETGVASGFSSASMLQALEDNAVGELHSLDLHYRDGVTIPVGKELGWVMPGHLKHRWHLLLGESVKLLPRLLKELRPVDLFLHDSRHTYRTMMKEYTIVWPHLREGGLLLSDDARINDAFLDFSDKVCRVPLVACNIGAIVK